jgi:hypothetical protein
MTTQIKSRFTDGTNFFGVTEVIQTAVGLTVYYYNKDTKQEYSCLLDAFSERFKEVENTDD